MFVLVVPSRYLAPAGGPRQALPVSIERRRGFFSVPQAIDYLVTDVADDLDEIVIRDGQRLILYMVVAVIWVMRLHGAVYQNLQVALVSMPNLSARIGHVNAA